MKANRINLLLALLLLAGVSGCSSSQIVTIDPKTGATQRKKAGSEWEMFTHSAEWDLQKELRGEAPSGASKTWEEYWRRHVDATRKYAKDAQERIAFIKKRRQELGLPTYENIFGN